MHQGHEMSFRVFMRRVSSAFMGHPQKKKLREKGDFRSPQLQMAPESYSVLKLPWRLAEVREARARPWGAFWFKKQVENQSQMLKSVEDSMRQKMVFA